MSISFHLGFCITVGPYYFVWNRPSNCIAYSTPRGQWFRDMRGQWHNVTPQE